MARWSSPNVMVEVHNASATFVNLSAFIEGDITLEMEATLEEFLAYGAAWPTQVATGTRKASDLTLEGIYDTTATVGPDAILNAIGATRQVRITWGGANQSTFSAVIKSYNRKASKGSMTRFEAVLVVTGAVT